MHEQAAEAVEESDEGGAQGLEVALEGVADEDKRFPSIVQQMENENVEAAWMEEHLDSSDEEYPVPAEWSNPGFGNPVAFDGRQQECEYRDIEVVKGAKYPSVDAVKEAVKR